MIVYQYDDGAREAYKECLEQVRTTVPLECQLRVLKKSDVFPNCDDYRAVSNILRVNLACVTPDMVWLDSDILVDKWFDFPLKKGKVYFGRGEAGKPEAWAFIVNGRTDFFQAMYKKFCDEKPKNIWWISEFIQENIDETELIPDGYLTHLMLSRAIRSQKFFNNYSTRRYRISKEKETGQLKIEVKK